MELGRRKTQCSGEQTQLEVEGVSLHGLNIAHNECCELVGCVDLVLPPRLCI